MIRYYLGTKLLARTPVDEKEVCWCTDEEGRGAWYPVANLTIHKYTNTRYPGE